MLSKETPSLLVTTLPRAGWIHILAKAPHDSSILTCHLGCHTKVSCLQDLTKPAHHWEDAQAQVDSSHYRGKEEETVEIYQSLEASRTLLREQGSFTLMDLSCLWFPARAHELWFSQIFAFQRLRPPPRIIPGNIFLFVLTNKGLWGNSNSSCSKIPLMLHNAPLGGHAASTACLLTQIIKVLPESLHPLMQFIPTVSSKTLCHTLSRHRVDNREVIGSSLGVLIHSSNPGFLGTTNSANDLLLHTGINLWPMAVWVR